MSEEKKLPTTIKGNVIVWKCHTCKGDCQTRIEKDGSHPIIADCPACQSNQSRMDSSEKSRSSPVWLTCTNSRCPVGCNQTTN